MVSVINIIAKDHKRWITIAKSFGLEEDAEDLVQDMYIKINQWKGKYDKTLMFNETEVNQYFIFKVLRNLFLDKIKKQKKTIKLSDTFYEPSTSAMSMEYSERLIWSDQRLKLGACTKKNLRACFFGGQINAMA